MNVRRMKYIYHTLLETSQEKMPEPGSFKSKPGKGASNEKPKRSRPKRSSRPPTHVAYKVVVRRLPPRGFGLDDWNAAIDKILLLLEIPSDCVTATYFIEGKIRYVIIITICLFLFVNFSFT